MKNLSWPTHNYFKLHKEIVSRKDDPDLRSRINSIDTLIESSFERYIQCFYSNSLKNLLPDHRFDAYKEDLLSLYSYRSKLITFIREELKQKQYQTIRSTCQYCTLNEAKQLDHILPKTDYPNFIVHALNLFPCCAVCNAKKSSLSSKDGSDFLNLYLDYLPKVQYLFINIKQTDIDFFDFDFFICNRNGVCSSLYNRIESHYFKLGLLKRFKLKSIEYLSEFESSIRTACISRSLDLVVKEYLLCVQENYKNYGYNHWKFILQYELLTNEAYLERFSS